MDRGQTKWSGCQQNCCVKKVLVVKTITCVAGEKELWSKKGMGCQIKQRSRHVGSMTPVHTVQIAHCHHGKLPKALQGQKKAACGQNKASSGLRKGLDFLKRLGGQKKLKGVKKKRSGGQK